MISSSTTTGIRGLLCILVIIVVTSACSIDSNAGNQEEQSNNNELAQEESSNNNEDENNNNPQLEPVTIRMQNVVFPEDDMPVLEELLADRYPHITLEWEGVEMSHDNREELERHILSGTVPDIYNIVPSVHGHLYYELGIVQDLTPFIEEFNFDLSRFDESSLESVRNASNEGLMGLPRVRSTGLPDSGALIYNIDIFDHFGVSYPEDGMTWNEAISLATQLTGESDNMHYYGLQFHPEYLVDYMSVGKRILDPETSESLINEEAVWRRAFDTIEQIYSIPGQLYPENPEEHFSEVNPWMDFIAEGNIAMSPWWNASMAVNYTEETGINWDLVGAPVFEDQELAPVGSSWTVMISSTSEHQEDAFRVLETIFSNEFMIHHGNGLYEPSRLPINAPAVHDQVDIHPLLEDKNLDALFYHEYGPPVESSPYESEMRANMRADWIPELVLGEQDVVSFMRELDDEIATLVEELEISQ